MTCQFTMMPFGAAYRSWLSRIGRPLAVGVALASLVGARPQCERRVAGAPCTGARAVVPRGTCTEIDNPCGPDWSNLFTLDMVDGVDGVYFEVERRPTGNTVRLCAEANAALTTGRTISYRVIDTSGTSRLVTGSVATIPPIVITVTNDPDTVFAGDTLQATAHVTGGIAPYRYQWRVQCSQGGEIIGPDTLQTATLTSICGDCNLMVRDALGTPAGWQPQFPTYALVTVKAVPKVISPGGQSNLMPTVVGPVWRSFWWTPTTGLVFPDSWDTVAKPAATTTYTFHVRTDLGLESQGSATITVQ